MEDKYLYRIMNDWCGFQIMLESFYKWYNFWQQLSIGVMDICQVEVEHNMEDENIKMPKTRVELR